MGAMFPFLQSPGTALDYHGLSNIMVSVFAMTSANSLRTLGCILSGPLALCTFRVLRWSQTWSYSVRDLAVPVLLYIHLRGSQKFVEYLSLLLIYCHPFASLAHWGSTLSLTYEILCQLLNSTFGWYKICFSVT